MSAELGALGAPAARVTSENAQDHLLYAELKGTLILLMILSPLSDRCVITLLRLFSILLRLPLNFNEVILQPCDQRAWHPPSKTFHHRSSKLK